MFVCFASNSSLININNCCRVDLPSRKPGVKELVDKNLTDTLKMIFSNTLEMIHFVLFMATKIDFVLK